MGTLTEDGRELLLRLETRLSELPFFAPATGLLIVTSLAVLISSLSLPPLAAERSADGASDRFESAGCDDLGMAAVSKAGMLRRRILLESS